MMKRMVLLAIAAVFVAASAWPVGLSVVVGGGYALGLDGEEMGKGIEVVGDTYEYYKYRFTHHGKGPRLSAEVDLELGKHFSIGLGGGGMLPDPWWSYADTVIGIEPVRQLEVHTNFGLAFLTLKGRVPAGRFEPYFGAGPSIGILPASKIIDLQDTERWEALLTYTTGFGFHGVVGVEFRAAKWLGIRMEVRGSQLTFRPKKLSIDTYTVDGEDMLEVAYPTMRDRRTVYVRDLSDFLNSPVNPKAPNQRLAYNVSADTIDVFIGVVLRPF